MSGVADAPRGSLQRARISRILASIAGSHPSFAVSWYLPIWLGRARPRRPARLTLPALVPAKPDHRRSRRVRPRPLLQRVLGR